MGFIALIAVIGLVFGTSPYGEYLDDNFGLGWLFKGRGQVATQEDVAVTSIDGNTHKLVNQLKELGSVDI